MQRFKEAHMAHERQFSTPGLQGPCFMQGAYSQPCTVCSFHMCGSVLIATVSLLTNHLLT